MPRERASSHILTMAVLASLLAAALPPWMRVQASVPSNISLATMRSEVVDFIAKEVAVHFGAIGSFTSPPDRVNGSITTGEFTWGSFMRVIAAQSEVTGTHVIAGKDTVRPIAEMGLYEARKGGKAF